MSVLIIAEAGVNHNGEKSKALSLIEVAAESGADVVKFQTFKASRLALPTAPKANYQSKNTNALESQFDMLTTLELPFEWHSELQAHAKGLGIEFISTAFDIESLAFLETLGLPFYKVPSGEITNGPLLLAFAQTGKRIILSTGMANLGEIEQALAILFWGYAHSRKPTSLNEIWNYWSRSDSSANWPERVSLLHCTSQYPTPMEEVNLRAIETLSQSFGLSVGYSDHTEGLLIPVAAVALGAEIIEEHFTLDRSMAGPDHRASLEPGELSQMVRDIRRTEIALGGGRKKTQPSEWNTRTAARQQIIASRDISLGEIFSTDNLRTARTGKGESPVHIWDLYGSRALRDYIRNSPIV